jgi:hypothetical protein
MRTPRQDDPSISAWEALHRGAEREGIDSPARFELSRVATVVRLDPMGHVRPPASDPVGQRRPSASDSAEQWRSPASGAVTQHRSRVRPYARTGGRTRSARDLPLEALVSTSEKGCRYPDADAAQHRAIRHLCRETRSVAEIAAYLSLPLGVVKVLVSDMADDGDLLIHQTGLARGDRSSREFMERVLQGLRAL